MTAHKKAEALLRDVDEVDRQEAALQKAQDALQKAQDKFGRLAHAIPEAEIVSIYDAAPEGRQTRLWVSFALADICIASR